MTQTLSPSSTAFVIVDMQNDFIHPKGAYGRNGQTSEMIAALPVRHLLLANGIHQFPLLYRIFQLLLQDLLLVLFDFLKI